MTLKHDLDTYESTMLDRSIPYKRYVRHDMTFADRSLQVGLYDGTNGVMSVMVNFGLRNYAIIVRQDGTVSLLSPDDEMEG